MERIGEVAPKTGLVYSQRGMLTGVMCKPKIMPIKSVTLEQIEEMEKKILEQFNKAPSQSQMERSRNSFSVSELNGPSSINATQTRIMGSTLNLDRRYQVIEVIGTGAYGIVVSARDTATGQHVAIKKMQKAFQHPIYAKRTLRELKILRLLDHDNIMRIKSIQLPVSIDQFSDIYVVTELMETDLSSIIRSPQPLQDEHCKFFLYQLLRGMKFMHSAKILHRDLKPRNLLVNSNCDLKICDFGLARPFFGGVGVSSTNMTDYVATRWYRPPELLLTFKRYTQAMDVWSVGTILGQLLLRRPILPGNDANHQLELIFNLIGSPSEEDIAAIPNPRVRERINRLPVRKPRDFQTVFRGANPEALDLLRRMLAFNPQRRITVEQALQHPYVAEFHSPNDEPVISSVNPFDFQFQTQFPNSRELKRLLYQEALLYHFTSKQQEYEAAKCRFSRDSFDSQAYADQDDYEQMVEAD